jgi:hypothetical protein
VRLHNPDAELDFEDRAGEEQDESAAGASALLCDVLYFCVYLIVVFQRNHNHQPC